MEFHPGKCQLLKVTNKKQPIPTHYTIHDTPLLETDSAKYLGVVIDSNLNWRYQYSSMIKKCNSTLAFIRRNLSKSPKVVKKKVLYSPCETQIRICRCCLGPPPQKPHRRDRENTKKSRKIRHRELQNGNRKFRI